MTALTWWLSLWRGMSASGRTLRGTVSAEKIDSIFLMKVWDQPVHSATGCLTGVWLLA